MPLFLLVLLACCALGVWSECDFLPDENPQTGARGQLVFSYRSTLHPGNFNKPLILGGTLEVQVAQTGSLEPSSIDSLVSLNPDVLKLTKTSPYGFRIHAHAVGDASVQVRAMDAQGRWRQDVVSWRVRKAEEIAFSPPGAATVESGRCGSTKRLEAEVGAKVRLPWKRRAAWGEVLTGEGAYPVEGKPKGALRWDTQLSDERELVLWMPAQPMRVVLAPQSPCGGDTLEIDVVAPRE